MKITYAVTAVDEHVELERLLRFLRDTIRKQDEVIIQLDEKHSQAVLEVCNLFTNFNHTNCLETYCIPNSKFYVVALNNDFATFKNEIQKRATGDYIFQIDADEMPTKYLIESLPEYIELNPVIDMYLIPRINKVTGITEEHINRWGWRVNEKGWINFPDWQWRIYKNDSSIQWKNTVHEQLTGFKHYTMMLADEKHALIHEKTIARQERQNEFYEKF